MVTRSIILAWKMLWTEETGSNIPCGHKDLDMNEQLRTHTYNIYFLDSTRMC